MEISKNASSSRSNNNGNHYRWSSSDSRCKDDSGLSDKNRIGFLNQCKLELSAEVYHWKEENFKLKKENEAAFKKIEELESTLNKVSQQNVQLENNLLLSHEDNKRLKMRTLAIGEQNSMLYERLAKSRFHSYPWSEIVNQNHTNSVQDASSTNKESPENTESLDEVSKRLFKQMQEEILEMQKFEHSLGVHEVSCIHQNKSLIEENPPNTTKVCNETEEKYSPKMDEAGKKVKILLHEVNTLKHHIKFQNERLHFLISQMAKGNENKPNTSSSCDKKNATLNSLKCTASSLSTSSRPTDETFRAYFTKQLNSCKTLEDGKKLSYENQSSMSKKCTDKESSPNTTQQAKYQTSIQVPFNAENHSKVNEDADNRICPICKITFAKLFPQREFEAHVIEHLEAVGTSLLDQC